MTAHPMTHRARLLAEEYDGGWLILSLCDALDGMQAQQDAALCDMADGGVA